jgi:hypothetical protein
MKHEINTTEQLLQFLKANWNRLTDFGYTEIIRETLNVFEFNKPETFEIAETRIKEFLSKYGNPNIEKPLFFEIDFDES